VETAPPVLPVRNALNEIAAAIVEADSIAVVSHTSPDGDALGSVLGLYLSLTAMGKRCWAVNDDPVPWSLMFLPGADQIVNWDNVVVQGTPDLIVSLDCSDLKRTGLELTTGRRLPDVRLVEIDHHVTNTLFGSICCVDPEAACVGELVYDLVTVLGVTVDADIATCLLTAHYTDTGSFQYSNVNRRTFTCARNLLEAGGRHTEIARQVFRRKRYATARLWGLGLGTLQQDAGGKVVAAYVSLAMQQECGLVDEGTEGLVEYLAGIDGADLAVFFREASDGTVKVSCRTTSAIDATVIALMFGGGGHPRAAGCSLPGPLNAAKQRVLAEAVRMAS